MNLFNAIYSLYEQQPAIFWAALITIVFGACARMAFAGIKLGARDWLADDPVEAESSIGYDDAKSLDLITKQLPSFTTPAAKGWQLTGFERVSPTDSLDVFNTMKRTTEQPVRVVGTGTRSLRVEVK